MDISMPKLNGIEATKQIKARHPATDVLVLTAYDDDKYIFALLEAGAVGYLLKNVRSDELVKAVRAVHAVSQCFIRRSLAKSSIASRVPKMRPAKWTRWTI